MVYKKKKKKYNVSTLFNGAKKTTIWNKWFRKWISRENLFYINIRRRIYFQFFVKKYHKIIIIIFL